MTDPDQPAWLTEELKQQLAEAPGVTWSERVGAILEAQDAENRQLAEEQAKTDADLRQMTIAEYAANRDQLGIRDPYSLDHLGGTA